MGLSNYDFVVINISLIAIHKTSNDLSNNSIFKTQTTKPLVFPNDNSDTDFQNTTKIFKSSKDRHQKLQNFRESTVINIIPK